MKTVIRMALILALLGALVGLEGFMPAQAELAQNWTSRQLRLHNENKIDPALELRLDEAQPEEMIPVIVTLNTQVDFSKIGGPDREARTRGLIRAMQAVAEASQRNIKALIETRMAQGLASQMTNFWVFNGLSVTATEAVIHELAARDDVLKITPDEIAIEPESNLLLSVPEPNLSVINAPALWDLGYFGQGIVVASMDTGVDGYHPDLLPRWRGGNNSWYDPYGQHPNFPVDLNGHGTWSMGVMVGGDAGGTSLGVAPQSQWIAVKIFNDSGASSATAIHLGYQWILDPDGNVDTADLPHVVNNSWTFSNPGCDLEFELDLQALRAADILPVFAAGNGGPNPATSYSPANNPSAFAVGATDNSDFIYYNSSRGPSSCGETENIYPELVAPGMGIYTTERYGLYTSATGTSLSAPHVSGGLALLLSSFSNLRVDEQSAALMGSAVDLGLTGPDNNFGYGRLDLLAAFHSIQSGATPTPTNTATPTATPDLSVNLAINQPALVSSYQDTDHTGSQAVDNDLITFWQSKRAVGKKVSSSEWIKVDLGTQATVSQVALEWEQYYARAYTLQFSSDDIVWITAFSTASGDGGRDTIDVNQISARYVMVESTDWNDSSLRNWLKEIRIYGTAGSPLPSPTPTPVDPAPTPTNTPTPSATPGAGSLIHAGDLDGTGSPGTKNRWDAAVFISVHDAYEMPVVGATVSGDWSGGASGNATCVTDSSGVCFVTLNDIKSNVTSVTFILSDISAATAQYLASANHDPDGDSDGTNISVLQP